MEKRVLVAVLMSFLVLYGYQAFVIEPARRESAAKRAAQVASAPAQSSTKPAAAPFTPAAAQAPTTAAPASPTSDAPARDITIETQVVRAVLTPRGAHLKSWQLKKYFDSEQRPVDLVPQNLPPDAPQPFMLRLDDRAASDRLNRAAFQVTGAGSDRVDVTSPVTLTFEFGAVSRLRTRKSFVFSPDTYVIQFSAEVRAGDRQMNPAIVWGPGLGDLTVPSRYLQAAEGIFHRAGKVERISAGTTATQPSYEGPFRYAGADDHYFLSASVGAQGPTKVEYEAFTPPPPLPGTTSATLVNYVVWFAQPPSGVQFFFGPKDFDVLQAIDREFVRVINYGMFSWLAVPLLKALKWIDQYVGNYGWSIIFLTILINVAMFPLRHKSVVSMRKMQELQPEVKAVQDRYAKFKSTDPESQKMRVELMNLYRERGVNPASGCIPMLLTMPVLFAFYALLSQAIEIRGAPFMLWIKDLSIGDPFYVTPILMGVTMVVQQRMTPATGTDPMQQKMMMMMPVMFTVMGLWMPSGLVLYWFTSNVLTIGQQYVTNLLIGPTKLKSVSPAAERRVKQAGAGKTEAAARAPENTEKKG